MRVGVLLAMGIALAVAGAQSARAGTEVVAVDVVDAVPRGPSVDERLAEIRRRIQHALVYPPSARQRALSGLSELEFVVGVDGRAENVTLVGSSGHRILDRAAERAVVAAGVLPRVYGRLRVPVRFSLED